MKLAKITNNRITFENLLNKPNILNAPNKRKSTRISVIIILVNSANDINCEPIAPTVLK
ncbi:MAG: hypothetical protein IKJ59_14965 [Clostridia bacterium]|nr:hypothetical protein [Clostridia bacterium]